MCEQIIGYGREGYTITEMACRLEVDRRTLDFWADDIPDFSRAFTRAKLESQAWWEAQLRKGNVGNTPGQINPGGWKHSMNCRFREDYGDKLDLTNSDGNFTPPKTIYVVGEPVEPDDGDD